MSNVGEYENFFNNSIEKRLENGIIIETSIFGHEIIIKEKDDEKVQRAKRKYLKTVIEDLDERFEDLNEDTASFRCIYKCLQPYPDYNEDLKILANLYKMDATKLEKELKLFRSLVEGEQMEFKNFRLMAKFVLNSLPQAEFPLIKKLFSILLVLPFATAACERSFSAMNRIKTPERSKLKTILNDLMLTYTCTKEEKKRLDYDKMAEYVVNKIWKYKKSDPNDPYWSKLTV